MKFPPLGELYKPALFVAGEIALPLLFLGAAHLGLRVVFRRLETVPALARYGPAMNMIRRNIRTAILLLGFLVFLGIMALNGHLIYKGKDIPSETLALAAKIQPASWKGLILSILKVAGLAVAAALLVRAIRKGLAKTQAWVNAHDRIKGNDESIEVFVRSLDRIQRSAIWLTVLILSAGILNLRPGVSETIFVALKVYLIIAIGHLVVKSAAVVVDSLDGLSRKHARPDNILRFYQHVSKLVPLFRRCLEYAIYVSVATLVLLQLKSVASFADYGPRLIQAIGIVFLARVAVEVVNLLVDRSQTSASHLSDVERQQRMTLVPLIKSFFRAIVYFVTLVMILKTFNFDPLPLLAGAGLVTLVIGLGAQPIINDLAAGFFILFEGLFLVGDYIETGGARGTVELVGLRTTRIRDPDGQQHILRNGQLANVVNYSKTYAFAVVDVGVSYQSDLDKVYRVLRETGAGLKDKDPRILEPTAVNGLDRFGSFAMTIRTTTKVKPGLHAQVARDLRRSFKDACDRENIPILGPGKAPKDKDPE